MTITLCDSRIELIPATLNMLKTELDPSHSVFESLDVTEPAYWPPELNDEDSNRFFMSLLETDPQNVGWSFYYAVDTTRGRKLVGNGGYLGKPSKAGTVEIGYSILTPFRRQGIATALTRLLVQKAFADARVHKVLAKTLPGFAPSIGVLLKMGFIQTDTNDEFSSFELKRP